MFKRIFNKGQEEMVGFALIIIIVAIIGVVLLVIARRDTHEIDQSRELNNLLSSVALSTSNCSILEQDYIPIKELIKACAQGKECREGKACTLMNESLVRMMAAAFPPGGAVNNYYLSIEHNSSQNIRKLMVLGGGNCTATRKGADYFYPANLGSVTITLEACYSE